MFCQRRSKPKFRARHQHPIFVEMQQLAQQQKDKDLFIIMNEILVQQKGDKNKIYSIHESEICCFGGNSKAVRKFIRNLPRVPAPLQIFRIPTF